MNIALAGNPNSGKTTLFNRLTGTRQSTGNWPGVTVEKKEGLIRHQQAWINLIDLPGIYSLSPYSLEERVTYNAIICDAPDVLINIIDATNLERNLYLTLQLKRLGRPMIIALNMMDEILSHGDKLDVKALSERLGILVVPISAKKNEGIRELIQAAVDLGNRTTVTHETCDRDYDDRFEPETAEETEAMYAEAAQIQHAVLEHSHAPDALSRSDRIDRILTHRIFALPIFLLIMFIVFQVTFSEQLGGRLTALFQLFFQDLLSPAVSAFLALLAAPDWLNSLLVDGVISGVGGILSFLPQIAILFIFLTIMEDSGYMARTAFLVDRLFQKFGLSGRSFIPMIMGFGCTVPAILAARSLENERERRLTIMITPFMSCSARMPIYILFTSLFFSEHKGLITFSLYLLGILVAVLSALLLNRLMKSDAESTFIIELPPYRLPDLKSLLLHVWDKVYDFIVRAGTIIFLMAIVIWLLQSFSPRLAFVTNNQESILSALSGLLAPLFAPLGFGNWQSVSALLTGLIAKESVVSTLHILFPQGTLTAFFSPPTAYLFMVFTLLYTPCVAAIGVTRQEMGSTRWTLAAIGWQTGTAYLAALLISLILRLTGLMV